MRLFNSLTRQKEEFIPLDENLVTMYACGPTVYDYFHVGNARAFVTFDLLRRYLKLSGYNVKFVQNFTDVDDKMISRANKEGITVADLANRFIAEYQRDAKALGIEEADIHPKATETMDDIIALIKVLIDKGYAYQNEGDVYFSTSKFKDYGKLSHQPLEDLEVGARVEKSDKKAETMDFALWKAQKPDEPFWQSPWGNGRPGWHIECSAMSKKYLGESIDIHCGGVDLIFPHHENEIAQSECASGKEFAKYWLHNGHINVDNRKMSKSLGNFFTVRESGEKYGYDAIRFFLISSHYRSPINFSIDALTQANAALARLYNAADVLDVAKANLCSDELSKDEIEILESLPSFKTRFISDMNDDFNTAGAISVIFELARLINTVLVNVDHPKEKLVSELNNAYFELCNILGIFSLRKSGNIPEHIIELIKLRKSARSEKNFKMADEIRTQLTEFGATIEDTKDGVKVTMKTGETGIVN